MLLQKNKERYLINHEDLVVETLDTLGLLIPRDNPKCYEWMKTMADGKIRLRDILWGIVLGQPQSFFKWITRKRPRHLPNIEAAIQLPAPRKVSHYKVWRQRLKLLEKEFNEAEPRNLRTWFHDRRRRKDWFTFWLAVAALILATILGGAGVGAAGYTAWAAKKTLDIAEAAPAPGNGTASPMTIVVCCSPTGNGSFSTYTPTLLGPPSTATVLVTATVTNYATITTTAVLSILESTSATQT